MLDVENLAHKIFKNDFCNNKVVFKYIHTTNPVLYCHISINNRLKVTGGQEFKDFRDNDYHIQISGLILNHYPKCVIIGVMKHEIVHYLLDYYCVRRSNGNLVRAHGKEFKNVLKSVNGLYTIVNTFYNYNPLTYYYIFKCENCGNYFVYQSKNANQQFICNCHGKLELIDKIKSNDYLKSFIKYETKKPTNNVARVNNKILSA